MSCETRFGKYLLDHDIDTHDLAKRTGRSIFTINQLMYRKGIDCPLIAMGYAYALNCDHKELMEKRETINNRGWADEPLPFGD